jgi:hypothetical protein
VGKKTGEGGEDGHSIVLSMLLCLKMGKGFDICIDGCGDLDGDCKNISSPSPARNISLVLRFQRGDGVNIIVVCLYFISVFFFCAWSLSVVNLRSFLQ